MLLSEQGQHSSSSGLTLPQQQNQQAGSQTQSASSMDQLQNGLVQYQPSGSNPEPPTANTLGQYQAAGNNETPLAREDLNSDAIVEAQLTHHISRDDAAQGQDAPDVPDAPMPDAPTAHDIATPRRTIGDAANGASVHSLPQVSASVLPAVCVGHDSVMVKHVWATVKPTNTTYMHFVSMGVLATIMNCSQSKPQIRMQLMQSPANGSGSNTSCETASKTCGARRTLNHPQGSSFLYNKLNMPLFEPSFTTTLPHWHQSQLGKRLSSAAGSFWEDLQLTPLKATAHTFWMRDWSSFGLRTGLLSGPWYVLNVMLLRRRTRRAERTSSKSSHVYAKSLH